MSRRALVPALLAGLLLTGADRPPGAPGAPTASPAPGSAAQVVPGTRPAWRDRLSWNAGERTAAGLEQLEADRPADAADALDTAWRLAPDSPAAAYNAGTARLLAGRADALPALEAAARAAIGTGDEDALAADALYNLGTARLASGDPRGAIESLTEALRRDSSRIDAKHNLELALRKLAEQEQQGDPQQSPQGSQSGDDSDDTSGQGEDSEAQSQSGSDGETGADSDDSRPSDGAPQPGDESGDHSQSQPRGEADPASSSDEEAGETPTSGDATDSRRAPLRDFRDQPGMTAEQAAALLEAVDHLERQQRVDRARARQRERASVEKDW